MPRLFIESPQNEDFWNKHNITSEDFVYVIDNFNDKWLSNFLQKNEIPSALISEYSFYQHPDFDINHIGLPVWLELEAKKAARMKFLDPVIETDSNFNFIFKKKRLSRFLLSKCIEIHGLTNYEYTWSGSGREFDLSCVLGDIKSSRFMNQTQKSLMLSPIKFPEKFIDYLVDEQDPDFNIKMWELAFEKIFSKSAVSLITETIEDDQKASMFTEKTLFSVLGFTFPIWSGSFAQAELWKEMGFDAFDDIVDHRYQHENTIVDRVVRSISDNRQLLQDINLSHDLRKKCRERFEKNKELLLSGKVSEYIENKIKRLDYYEQRACEIVRSAYVKKIQGVHEL